MSTDIFPVFTPLRCYAFSVRVKSLVLQSLALSEIAV